MWIVSRMRDSRYASRSLRNAANVVRSARRQMRTGEGLMKRHATGIAAATALLVQQGSALAQDLGSANQLMPGCRAFVNDAHHDHFQQGNCAGRVTTTVQPERVT